MFPFSFCDFDFPEANLMSFVFYNCDLKALLFSKLTSKKLDVRTAYHYSINSDGILTLTIDCNFIFYINS